MKALLIKIRQILRDRRTRRFLTRFVSGIAAIVVFVTTYALVLPAITMESQAACGIEAHQHDDSCYSEELVCGLEESEGHHHTEDCYTVTRDLVCQIEEHQHSSENGCFAEDGSLICTLEEHTHNDSCYEENRELTCGLEESEGHHHTESCYEKVLTCGKEIHTHSAACYKADLQIESAAVASTGMTSAAAEIEDENAFNGSIVSEADEVREVNEGITAGSDHADRDDENVDADADHGTFDADESDTDTTDAEDSADNSNQNTADHKDTDGEGEESASSFSTGFAAGEDAENGDVYIPDKDALDFYTVLNRKTGIYYHHVAENEDIEDSSAITDWTRADKDTELNPQDIVRVYLSYTLPKDTINATNDISRYRLPNALHLTDDQIEAINSCENGISAQYMDYDNLEITDPERHAAYLGLESVEGSRRPGEEQKEDSPEYISAVVRAQKIYDEDSGEYQGTDLIFTFSPYAVEKNAHAYDKKGQPTRAGEEVTGWLTLDFNMGQIDWAEDNTSEIVFAEEDEENDISEISTVLRRADDTEAEEDERAADETAETAAEDMTADAAATDATAEAAAADATGEAALADNTSEKAEETGTEKTAAEAAEDLNEEKDKKEESAAVSYPAAVFDDSITVRSGRLDTDLDDTDIPKKTKMTVHVEADEGTFPEGTKMVLSAVEDINAVAEAVGTAIDAKTRGFQAVDITFYDKDPSEEDAKEIEPLKPIRVSIKSDEIRKAAEDSSTAPVVVHIEDDNTATEVESTASKTDSASIEIEKPGVEGEMTAPGNDSGKNADESKDTANIAGDNKESEDKAAEDKSEDKDRENAANEDAGDDNSGNVTGTNDAGEETDPAADDSSEGVTGTNDAGEETDSAADNSTEGMTGTNDAGEETDPAADDSSEGVTGTVDAAAGDAVSFEAGSFSIYAVVYTVDFYAQVISADGETYEITVHCGEEAQIPYGSKLKVREILPEDEEYSDLYKNAVKKANDDAKEQGIEMPVATGARLFDIEIHGAEGKIEPAAPVQVSIRLAGMTSAEHTSVVHFAKEGAEAMTLQKAEEKRSEELESEEKKSGTTESKGEKSEDKDSEEKDSEEQKKVITEVSFEADSFSVYSIIKVTSLEEVVNNGPYAIMTENGPGIHDASSSTNTNITRYAMDNTTVDFSANNGTTLQTVAGKVVYYDAANSIAGGDVAEWYFEPVNPNDSNTKYYVYTITNGQRYYLNSNANSVGLVTNPGNTAQFGVGVSDNKIYLTIAYNNWRVTNEGDNPSHFCASYHTGDDTLFTLCKVDPDYEEMTAKKVSAENWKAENPNHPGRWDENSTIIIYRRVEQADGSEKLYALATDGTYVPVYDGGDTIYYHTKTGKDLRWHVTYDAENGYRVSNIGNTVYLSPSVTDSTWSSDTPEGLTMNGMGTDYGTTIMVWDQESYAYAGLNLDEGNPSAGASAGTGNNIDTFLFAVTDTLISEGQLHTVDTVNSTAEGITMKIFNYGGPTYNYGYRNAAMQAVLGNDMLDNWETRKSHVTPMVQSKLGNDGFPVSISTGESIGKLFTAGSTINYEGRQYYPYGPYEYEAGSITVQGQEANNLFLQSYFDESKTFRYSSMENFAHFNTDTGDFTVYREAGTPNIPTMAEHYYYYHGHFMPYNDLDPNVSVARIVDQYGSLTDKENARSYEDVYGLTATPDYYVGMSMEATFVQPSGGTLENGDPVIYRFTGDDDLWVYIDGILVLDVGGIHEPLTGSINFQTGVVSQPNFYGEGAGWTNHTRKLYDIFKEAYDNELISPEKWAKMKWKDVDGDGKYDTFADYSTHSFNMFYMERGAGASNLDLQFNLQIAKSNEFTVEKQLPEGVDARFVNQTFRYRATYLDGNEEKPLFAGCPTEADEHHKICTKVIYKGMKDSHGQPIEVPVPVDNQGYFTLKAGEGAVFTMTNQTTQYNVREVNIDTGLIDQVDINSEKDVDIQSNGTYGNYAEAGLERVEERTSVVYTNHPRVQNLKITKHITADSLPVEEGENPVFEFRVYLESDRDINGNPYTDSQGNPITKLTPYSYGPYYVIKEIDGATHYFKLNGPNNTPMDQGTTPVYCSETGRSGSINSIPPDFTVVIPNLAVGTHFYVEERRDNIPGGYEFVEEVLDPDSYDPATMYSQNEYEQNHQVIDRILARDEKDHQEFDPSTIGKIKNGVDAHTRVWNRRPAVDIPVEKVWDPALKSGETAPPVELALVRFEGPEPHKPAEGKGAIRINHNGLYIYGDNEYESKLPDGFVAEYTIRKNDMNGEIVVGPTIEKGPFDLDPGTYLVTARVIQPAEPASYEYNRTTFAQNQVVVADQTTEVMLQSIYVKQENPAESGQLIITHVSSGLPNTTDLPDGFSAMYIVSGQKNYTFTEPGTYNVEPGDYTVSVISAGTDPEGYTYVDTTPASVNVTVPDGGSDTAAFTSVYEPEQTGSTTIKIDHKSSGLPNTTDLPNGFTATYSIRNSNGVEVVTNPQPDVAYPVDPGTYTVTATVTDNAAPNGYSYQGTNQAQNIQVNEGDHAIAYLTSTYAQQVQNGYITINHTSSGLPDTNTLPGGFNATYTIKDSNGNTVYSGSRVTRHPVAPGNYTVSVNVSGAAAPSGYTYDVSGSTTSANVTVTSNNEATANLIAKYNSSAIETVDVRVIADRYDIQYPYEQAETVQVPKGGTLTVTVTTDHPPIVAKYWTPGAGNFNWNAKVISPVSSSGNTYVYEISNITAAIQVGFTINYHEEGTIRFTTATRSASTAPVNPNTFALDFFTGNMAGSDGNTNVKTAGNRTAAGLKGFTTDINPLVLYRPSRNADISAADPDDGEGDVTITDINPLDVNIPSSITGALPSGYTLDKTYGKRIVLSGDDNWQEILERQPLVDHNGNSYFYAIVELEVPENYTVSYTNNPVSAADIRLNMEARQNAEEQGNPLPPLVTMTATNTKKTGNLEVVKAIAPGSNGAGKTFTFKVELNGADPSRLRLNGNTIPANIITTVGNVTTITLTYTGAGSHTITGITCGTTYTVTEPTGTIPANWRQKGEVAITGGNYNKTIDAEETETATITNEQTKGVDATKIWDGGEEPRPTIYFRLFYRVTSGTPEDPIIDEYAVPDQPILPLASGDTSVHWDGVPIWMDADTEYEYIVKEYVEATSADYDYTDGNGHYYYQAAPEDYLKEENELTIKNIRTEEYNPTTSYSGTKNWVDPNNATRPNSLHLTLMIDDGDGNRENDKEATYKDSTGKDVRYTYVWTSQEGNAWTYTFGDLPVFDDEGNIIQYYVKETPATGYNEQPSTITPARYLKQTSSAPISVTNDYTFQIEGSYDLPYVAVKMTDRANAHQYDDANHQYVYHIWTARVATPSEKEDLLNLLNNSANGFSNPSATMDHDDGNGNTVYGNTRFVTGLPVNSRPNVELMWRADEPVGNGYKVNINKTGKSIKMDVNRHEYFQNILVGKLSYEYISGTTSLRNERDNTEYNGSKQWVAEVGTPPERSGDHPGSVSHGSREGNGRKSESSRSGEEPSGAGHFHRRCHDHSERQTGLCT